MAPMSNVFHSQCPGPGGISNVGWRVDHPPTPRLWRPGLDQNRGRALLDETASYTAAVCLTPCELAMCWIMKSCGLELRSPLPALALGPHPLSDNP